MSGELITLAGSLIVALFTFLGVKATNKSNESRDQPSMYNLLLGDMRQLMEDERAANEREITTLATRIGALEEEQQLRLEYDAWITKQIRQVQVWADVNGHNMPDLLSFDEWVKQHKQRS